MLNNLTMMLVFGTNPENFNLATCSLIKNMISLLCPCNLHAIQSSITYELQIKLLSMKERVAFEPAKIALTILDNIMPACQASENTNEGGKRIYARGYPS